MIIPELPSDVTAAWLHKVLQENWGTGRKIKIDDLQPSKMKNGLLSTVFLASVRKCDDGSKKENMDLFLKIMPQSFVHEIIIRKNFLDVTEIEFYRKALPKLKEFANTVGLQCLDGLVPQFIAG